MGDLKAPSNEAPRTWLIILEELLSERITVADCRSSYSENDFAESLIRLETSVSLLDLFESKNGIDHRLHTSLRQQWHDCFREGVRSGEGKCATGDRFRFST